MCIGEVNNYAALHYFNELVLLKTKYKVDHVFKKTNALAVT